MASHNIPYMTVPGTLVRILEKIKSAATPSNFNGDFLEKTLDFKGGNYRTFIPWAKKIGLINSDGTPSPLYKKFRNPSSSESSLGEALRKGYADIFAKDESCYKLDKTKLKGLFMEATGESHDSKVLELMVNSFWNSKTLAKFENTVNTIRDENGEEESSSENDNKGNENGFNNKKINLGLNYTINLVLPKTDDPGVYNAIFKSLRENLFKD